MYRLYSKGCQYTLRALMYFPLSAQKNNVTARDLCRKARIPEAYTRKIMQTLTQAGVLKAVSGPGGGYQLSRAPEEISLFDIITAVDGANTFNKCSLGMRRCSNTDSCPLYGPCLKAKTVLLTELKKQSIAGLISLQKK